MAEELKWYPVKKIECISCGYGIRFGGPKDKTQNEATAEMNQHHLQCDDHGG